MQMTWNAAVTGSLALPASTAMATKAPVAGRLAPPDRTAPSPVNTPVAGSIAR